MNPKEKYITKSIQFNLFLKEKQQFRSNGTILVKLKELYSNNHFYSLLQKKIDRICDIRVFCIKQQYFAMAIFVSKNTIDARSLMLDNELARIVSYKLPDELEDRINAFMNIKGINSGCIDFILSNDRQYYFLEVNPVGQFDYIEYYCNYPLSQTIAKTLCKS